MACPNDHPLAIDEIEPRSFSFNSPVRRLPAAAPVSAPSSRSTPSCSIPDDDLSLGDGAIAAVGPGLGLGRLLPAGASPRSARTSVLRRHAVAVAAAAGPGGAPATAQDYKVHVKYRNRYGRDRSYTTGFEGVVPFVKRRHAETDSDWSRERYEGYMREVPCPECEGARLKPESLAVLARR